MDKRRKVLAHLLAIGLLAAGVTYAQRRPKTNGQPLPEQRPFDISRQSLPPNYLGHSFGAVYAAVARRQLASKRGEYETTNDYQNRLTHMNAMPLIGSINSDSLIAFVIAPVRQEYDADEKTLHLGLVLTSFRTTWLHNEKLIGSYIGRNGFNRAVRVKAYRYDDYVLAIDRIPSLKSYSIEGDHEIFNSSIVIASLDAQKMKPRIRALLVCKLTAEGVSSDESHDPATIDEPYDEYSFTYTMHVNLHAVWFYDASNGVILAKVDLANEPQPIAKKPSCSPTITYKPEPHYTEEARAHEITGTVELSALFTVSGEITEIEVIKGLSYGLTERAIEAAKSIKSASPELAGKKIPCRVTLEFNFNLY
ncbi:MAG TPA: energy transducer TonB [Pyrinomonadaceae bacterium]|nr:energy transducer TonB [Pyrinomonadaceae bacterium]